jgi:hypothetical protein
VVASKAFHVLLIVIQSYQPTTRRVTLVRTASATSERRSLKKPDSVIHTVDPAAKLQNPYFFFNELGSSMRNSSTAMRLCPRSAYCSASSSMGKAFRATGHQKFSSSHLKNFSGYSWTPNSSLIYFIRPERFFCNISIFFPSLVFDKSSGVLR